MNERGCLQSVFNIIYITSPSNNQRDVYETLCNSIQNSGSFFRDTEFRCVSDPFGLRVGSGGGTLNVIDHVFNDVLKKSNHQENIDINNLRILIVHSGGDSRRSPIHSVCGKAWATLNSLCLNNFSNPLIYLLMEISKFCENLPSPSIVVGSSDVLLNITQPPYDKLVFPTDSVSIVAVPEILSVAKNHGVLIKSSESIKENISKHDECSNKNINSVFSKVSCYLQKPSIEEILKQSNQSETDTGIVIFTGNAVVAMFELIKQDSIKRCTYNGLKELLHLSSTTSSTIDSSSVIRIELYSDILHCLMLEKGESTLPEVYQRLGLICPNVDNDTTHIDNISNKKSIKMTNYDYAIQTIWNHMKNIPFYVIDVENGIFGHLGTSYEFLELLTSCHCKNNTSLDETHSNNQMEIVKSQNHSHNDKNILFSNKYSLQNQILSFLPTDLSITENRQTKSFIQKNDTGVVINSIITDKISIDKFSLIEHSILTLTNQYDFKNPFTGSVCSGCILSHIQPLTIINYNKQQLISQKSSNLSLHINKNIMLQQIPLTKYTQNSVDNLCQQDYILIVLGILDDVKAYYKNKNATICSVSWDLLFQCMHIDADFVWSPDVNENERSLWNAKLFPITDQSYQQSVYNSTNHSTNHSHSNSNITAMFLTSLISYTTYDSENDKKLFFENIYAMNREWSHLPHDKRLSLSDMLVRGDALNMHIWRCFIRDSSPIIKSSLEQNYNITPMNISPVSDVQNRQHADRIQQQPLAVMIEYIHNICYSHLIYIKSILIEIITKYQLEANSALIDNLNDSIDFNEFSSYMLLGVWLYILCVKNKLSDGRLTPQKLQKLMYQLFYLYLSKEISNENIELPSNIMSTFAIAVYEINQIENIFNNLWSIFHPYSDNSLNKTSTYWMQLFGTENSHHLSVLLCTYFNILLSQKSKDLLSIFLLNQTKLIQTEYNNDYSIDIESHPRLLLLCAWLNKQSYVTMTNFQKADIIAKTHASTNEKFNHDSSVSEFNNVNKILQKCHNFVSTLASYLIQFITESFLVKKSNSLLLKSTMTSDADSSPVVAVSETTLGISDIYESFAQLIVDMHIQLSLDVFDLNTTSTSIDKINSLHNTINSNSNSDTSISNKIYVAEAPARIDITGGWSDTPPICYETQVGGAVLNIAVQVDHQKPIRCASRFINKPVIILRSLKLKEDSTIQSNDTMMMNKLETTIDTTVMTEQNNNNNIKKQKFNENKHEIKYEYDGDVVECTSLSDFYNVQNTSSPCVLLKAVLIVLNIMPGMSSHDKKMDEKFEKDLFLNYLSKAICHSNMQQQGIEIACISLLPAGSGMGGSSIVAAAVLKSVSALLNINQNNNNQLIYQVLKVEQLLTTGGGWQDQIGAIYKGIKLATSSPSLPLQIKVELLDNLLQSETFIEEFESRTILIFTGQQRLAKNTLINALRKFALTDSHGSNMNSITNQLVYEANSNTEYLNTFDPATATVETVTETVIKIGKMLSKYWCLKKAMAEGSEPVHITRLFQLLQPYTVGTSLCGAGAGGFLVAILKESTDYKHIKNTISQVLNQYKGNENIDVTMHTVTVDRQGITVTVKDSSNYKNVNSTTNELSNFLF